MNAKRAEGSKPNRAISLRKWQNNNTNSKILIFNSKNKNQTIHFIYNSFQMFFFVLLHSSFVFMLLSLLFSVFCRSRREIVSYTNMDFFLPNKFLSLCLLHIIRFAFVRFCHSTLFIIFSHLLSKRSLCISIYVYEYYVPSFSFYCSIHLQSPIELPEWNEGENKMRMKMVKRGLKRWNKQNNLFMFSFFFFLFLLFHMNKG